MDTIKSIYKLNPDFVRDILNLQFFKTVLYYDDFMNDFPRLKISSELKIALFTVDYASSYTIEKGNYVFELKYNWLGFADTIPFPLLFNKLISTCHSSIDIEDMFNKMYGSKDPILIKFAEHFKDRDIIISSELFDFIKRKECDIEHNWQLSEIKTGSWNYTLLSLNEKVWESAFDNRYLTELFQNERKELDLIDESKLDKDGYAKYIINIYCLIHEKLQ